MAFPLFLFPGGAVQGRPDAGQADWPDFRPLSSRLATNSQFTSLSRKLDR